MDIERLIPGGLVVVSAALVIGDFVREGWRRALWVRGTVMMLVIVFLFLADALALSEESTARSALRGIAFALLAVGFVTLWARRRVGPSTPPHTR